MHVTTLEGIEERRKISRTEDAYVFNLSIIIQDYLFSKLHDKSQLYLMAQSPVEPKIKEKPNRLPI